MSLEILDLFFKQWQIQSNTNVVPSKKGKRGRLTHQMKVKVLKCETRKEVYQKCVIIRKWWMRFDESGYDDSTTGMCFVFCIEQYY